MARVSAAERREQLIEAAIAVAVRDGLAATTVRRVAGQADVSLGTVHYCFQDKDELLVAAARALAQPYVGPVGDVVEAGTGGEHRNLEELLRGALRAFWEVAESSRGRQLLTFELTTWALREDRPAVAEEMFTQFRATIGQFIQGVTESAGITWTQPRERIERLVLTVTNGVALAWLVDDDREAALEQLDLFAAQLAWLAEPTAPAH